MKRRTLLFAIAIATLALAGPATAATLIDKVVAQLRQQGYNEIEVSRTWLGRSRIVATSPANRREIIVNPRTGEILRDYWEQHSGAAGGSIYDPDEDDNSGHGGDDDDDNSGHGGGDDDDGDDDGNSGSGSDNSGHGGGDDDD